MSNGACPPPAPRVHESFDEVVLPHRDAAYRLARWLMRNEHDAEDAVQEASLRALRYFRTFGGGNGRAWFLRIVRNTCRGWRGRSFRAPTDPFDEEQHSSARPAPDPEALLLRTDGVTLIARAMSALPDRFRELLVHRELEGLSYQELADVMGIPIGTVMSGLSRARQAFRGELDKELKQSGIPEWMRPPQRTRADDDRDRRISSRRVPQRQTELPTPPRSATEGMPLSEQQPLHLTQNSGT